MPTLERPFECDILTIVTSRNALVSVWRDAPTLETLKELEKAGVRLAGRYPGQVFLMNVLTRGKPNFSAEVRQETARQTHDNPFGSVAGAHIVAVDGLTGVAARTFLSTTVLVGQPKRPTKVFGDVDAAARWLLPHVNGDGRPEWTEAAIAEVYAAAVRG